MGVKQYCSCHVELFLGCSAKIGHLSGYDAAGLLWRKKRQVYDIHARSCIEETCCSVIECIGNAIAEAELLRRIETYCNVQLICRKGQLFSVV